MVAVMSRQRLFPPGWSPALPGKSSRCLVAAILGLYIAAADGQVLRFTEDRYGDKLVPLGYPVPLPVESLSAVDGFRSYASLQAQLSALALTSADIVEEAIGTTIAGRAIYAYRLGDADTTTAEGFAEPSALINGTIHPREWASPEVVAAVVERFAERANDGGFYRYLLDNLSLVIIPVLNVDGFLQTQRYPDETLQTEFPDDPQPREQTNQPPEYRNYPRDGRMRRKNMRGVDEVLCAAGEAGCVTDGMLGVDLNRNSDSQFFDSGNQNSDYPRSLLYHGGSRGSEPETQALYAAAALAPRSRLRFYSDTHSFGRVFFGVNTGNPRRDAITRTLAERMSAATGGVGRYPYDPTPPDYGIGSTDEYFGFGEQIPTYTLEIEPTVNGAADYGAFGYHHDGFILPAAQIARVRRELADAYSLGLYRMAGPPTLLAAEIRRVDSGEIVYAARWQRSGDSRTQQIDAQTALAADVDYRLWLAFDKPMRVRDAQGNVVAFRGQTATLAPSIAIEGLSASGASFAQNLAATADGWRASGSGAPDGTLRYADDAYAIDFRLPASLPLANARRINLRVDVQDASGQKLDANPATPIDWSAGWTGYDDEQGRSDTDTGGADRTLRIIDDGSPEPGGGGGGGAFGALGLIAVLLLRALRSARRAR
ncbi:MAG: M14 family metallopeptidase [Gammaproteobacteria bacterium]